MQFCRNITIDNNQHSIQPIQYILYSENENGISMTRNENKIVNIQFNTKMDYGHSLEINSKQNVIKMYFGYCCEIVYYVV